MIDPDCFLWRLASADLKTHKTITYSLTYVTTPELAASLPPFSFPSLETSCHTPKFVLFMFLPCRISQFYSKMYDQ